LGLFEPIDEIDELALRRANVSLGCGVHVHEEVKEGEYFAVDVLDCHFVAAEGEIHVEMFANYIEGVLECRLYLYFNFSFYFYFFFFLFFF
jgi:hypothetical protein